ncbi:MAG: prephenate dehydrogenase/arogenate dehydrogenase family protein [Planctomycetota bacterium]
MAGLEHTTIVGVGLIGGSLGLALKQRGLASVVVGVGYRETTLERAQERGLIDRWTLDVAEGAAGADIVVLCTPVGLVAGKAAEALPAMKPGSILTDVASTKAAITAKIEAMLPGGIAFVPAHPMAGSEKRGNESAQADLFEGSRCILTPTAKTPADAVAAVTAMWEGVGASVETLDVGEHDRIVAQISHLPHLVAPAVLNAADGSSLPYAAAGMKDTTRIAASDVKLWIDIFKDNRENVLEALAAFGSEMHAIRDALDRSDWDKLAEMLERARDKRASLDDAGRD